MEYTGRAAGVQGIHEGIGCWGAHRSVRFGRQEKLGAGNARRLSEVHAFGGRYSCDGGKDKNTTEATQVDQALLQCRKTRRTAGGYT